MTDLPSPEDVPEPGDSEHNPQDDQPEDDEGMQLYVKILIGMLIGIVLGFLVGPNSSLLPQSGVSLGQGAEIYAQPEESGLKATVVSPDKKFEQKPETGVVFTREKNIRRVKLLEESGGEPNFYKVEWKLTTKDAMRLESAGVEDLKAGSMHEGWVKSTAPSINRYAPIGQMLVDGTEWVGRLFLALIKMVVVPLVLFSLIVGVASLGDFRKLGRLGGATIGFFAMTTVVALTIGILLTNLIQPGELISEADRATLLSSYAGDAGAKLESAAAAPSFIDQIVGIVPENPFAALANGDMLAVIFLATMVGIAFTLIEEKKAKIAIRVVDALNESMVMLVHIAMAIAPFGVAALLFEVVGTTGWSVLVALGAYGAVVLLGLFSHIVITYGSVLKYAVGLPLFKFIGAIRSPLFLAFSTSSSSATLPVTMEAVESNVNVSEETASFVLPIGATINMDGTGLYQAVAAVFIAQIYGFDLSMFDQATIVISATLASVGAAGVPGAGMITLAMVLTAIGVPARGVALVLGVDRILDMFRTTTNVVGDATASTLIATMQGEDLRIVSPEEDASDPEHGLEGRRFDSHSVSPDE